ncbi:hypothetical protein QFC21_003234 [Naganishia friedmannii]|uniref:Uncharacterized protein n=1 Tax=Naganishia friedmannii TaxID=89922 RepID=A0ACC2VSF8_9TREE|nr:hypothetical protein QFC21_003234 [Naganishia friedmannii]
MPSPSDTGTASSDGFRRTVLHSVPERRESASRQARQQEEEDAAAVNSNAASNVHKFDSREGNTEMRARVSADERQGSSEGDKPDTSSSRHRSERILSDRPGPAFDRRKSSLSYGYRLPDGRFRPPETEEEWNAFYQEYITGDTVTHTEKFLVSVKCINNEGPSPLSGSPLVRTEPILAEEPKRETPKAADFAYRNSNTNLATAFISPRPSVSMPSGTGASRRSGDSLYSGYSRYPPPEHRPSQDLPGLTTPVGQSPSDVASPAETSRAPTPGTGRNQDPKIPNIDYAQFSKNRASYQSGMKVSSSRREDELDAEKPQTWGSDAAYQQRDLARLLGQSSAKVMKRSPSQGTKHSDMETETEDGGMSSPSVATVQQGMADLSGLGGRGAESPKEAESPREDVPERPRSTDLEHGSESSQSEGDEAAPAHGEGNKEAEKPSSPEGAVQAIPYSEPEEQQTTAIPETNTATHFAPAYRIGQGPTLQATLPPLQEEQSGATPAPLPHDSASAKAIRKEPRPQKVARPHNRSVRRVGELRHPRTRLDSDVSEDPYRIDVTARQRAEALRLKEVWEQKGHLTAPRPLPGDARRRAKAIWKLGLDRPGEEIHRSALDRYVRLAKAQDLAACIGGELELLYVHEEQKFQQIMHEIQFLRDCLQVQHIPDVHRKRKEKLVTVEAKAIAGLPAIVQTDKAKGDKINLSTASRKEIATESRTTGSRSSSVSSRSSHLMTARAQTGRADEKRARNLQYDEIDRHHPQVRFLPGKRRRTDQQTAIDVAHKVGTGALDHPHNKDGEAKAFDMAVQIPTLGRWAESEDVHFDINIPSAKEALTAFIATNLQGRRYWFERDESEVSGNERVVYTRNAEVFAM